MKWPARSSIPIRRTPSRRTRYANLDVALDPFPFAGGATTCDALLTAAGRPQWIAHDVDGYVAMAAALAGPGTLAREREALSAAIGTSALFDVPRFTRALERGFVAMIDAVPASREPLVVDAS